MANDADGRIRFGSKRVIIDLMIHDLDLEQGLVTEIPFLHRHGERWRWS